MNENETKAKQFANSVGKTMVNLAERWKDESKYEDIADYQKVIQKAADPHGITIQSMVKRPFGCNFKIGDTTFTMTVSLRGSQARVGLSYIPGK